MAQPIVTRVRGQLSSKVDGYFEDSDILDYTNEGYKTVVSEAIRRESELPRKGGSSIRALDSLRRFTTFSNLPTETYRKLTRIPIDLTTELEADAFEKMLYLGGEGDKCGPLLFSELTSMRKKDMDWGVLHPTGNQAYYEYQRREVDEVSHLFLVLYVAEPMDVDIELDYIKSPTLIAGEDEHLPDMPDRLINAVVTKAALLGGLQELRENAESFSAIYDREIRTHLW